MRIRGSDMPSPEKSKSGIAQVPEKTHGSTAPFDRMTRARSVVFLSCCRHRPQKTPPRNDNDNVPQVDGCMEKQAAQLNKAMLITMSFALWGVLVILQGMYPQQLDIHVPESKATYSDGQERSIHPLPERIWYMQEEHLLQRKLSCQQYGLVIFTSMGAVAMLLGHLGMKEEDASVALSHCFNGQYALILMLVRFALPQRMGYSFEHFNWIPAELWSLFAFAATWICKVQGWLLLGKRSGMDPGTQTSKRYKSFVSAAARFKTQSGERVPLTDDMRIMLRQFYEELSAYFWSGDGRRDDFATSTPRDVGNKTWAAEENEKLECAIELARECLPATARHTTAAFGHAVVMLAWAAGLRRNAEAILKKLKGHSQQICQARQVPFKLTGVQALPLKDLLQCLYVVEAKTEHRFTMVWAPGHMEQAKDVLEYAAIWLKNLPSVKLVVVENPFRLQHNPCDKGNVVRSPVSWSTDAALGPVVQEEQEIYQERLLKILRVEGEIIGAQQLMCGGVSGGGMAMTRAMLQYGRSIKGFLPVVTGSPQWTRDGIDAESLAECTTKVYILQGTSDDTIIHDDAIATWIELRQMARKLQMRMWKLEMTHTGEDAAGKDVMTPAVQILFELLCSNTDPSSKENELLGDFLDLVAEDIR